jgi:hypothetical protein
MNKCPFVCFRLKQNVQGYVWFALWFSTLTFKIDPPTKRFTEWHLLHFIQAGFLCLLLDFLEILGHCQNHKSDTCLKADGQGKIHFSRRLCLWQVGKHTKAEGLPQFLSLTQDCPCALMEGAQVHSLRDWLRLSLEENIGEEQTWLEGIDMKLKLVCVLKDKGVTHQVGILGFWGNSGLKMTAWPGKAPPSI